MNSHRLLEREELLDGLSAHAVAAARGDGRLVFIGGEAGAGKSALVEQFRQRHSADTLIHLGACDAMSAPSPLAPLLDIAAELGAEFAHQLEQGVPRRKLFASLISTLREGSHPHLLIFEDLHWADEATLDLLLYLGRRIAEAPALFIGTYRETEVGSTHPFRRLLGDLAGASAVHRMEVPPLSLAAVELMASDSELDPGDLHARTRGNPFFVTEILAAPSSGLPARVGDAVLARVSRLSPEAIDALELVSVLGPQAATDLMLELGSTPTAIDECVVGGLLVSRRGTVSFRHDLARQAVFEAIPPTRRAITHAHVLAALEHRYGTVGASSEGSAPTETVALRSKAVLAVLSHHAHLAGDIEAVLRYAPAAGHLASELGSFREAREQFSRALPYADQLGLEGHVSLLGNLATASSFTDHPEESVALRRAAIDLLSSPEHAESRARHLCLLSWTLCSVCRDEEATVALDQAARLVEELPESDLHATVSYLGGWKIYPNGEAGLRLARKAQEIARRTNSPWILTRATTVAAMALAANGRITAAKHELALSTAVAEENGYHVAAATNPMQVGFAVLETFRCRQADALLDRAAAMSRETDQPVTMHQTVSYQAMAHLMQGRWRDAEEAVRWVENRPEPSPTHKIWISLIKLLVRVRSNAEPGEYMELVAKHATKTPRLAVIVETRAALAEAALATGDADSALVHATAVYDRVLEDGSHWYVARLAYWIWRAGGDPRLPESVGGPFALQVRGRPAQAAQRWARLGCPFEQARALVETDEPESLTEALKIFETLGAKPAAAATATRLRQLGVRGVPRGPHSSTKDNPAGLTSRERQVLGLLVRGLRNAEIAAHNRVSPRTVDHQVSAVLGKLGVRSRAEAVAAAHRLGLVALAAPYLPAADRPGQGRVGSGDAGTAEAKSAPQPDVNGLRPDPAPHRSPQAARRHR